MKPNYKAIAADIRGTTIIAAPHCCSDQHEFMKGAREQANNIIHALCCAFALDDLAFDKQAFIKACSID